MIGSPRVLSVSYFRTAPNILVTAVIVLQLVLYLSASIGAEAIVITMILVLGSKLILGMDKIIGVLDIDTQSIDQAYTLFFRFIGFTNN